LVEASQIGGPPFPGTDSATWQVAADNAYALHKSTADNIIMLDAGKTKLATAWSGASADAVIDRTQMLRDAAGTLYHEYFALFQALTGYSAALKSGEQLYGDASGDEAYLAYRNAVRDLEDAQGRCDRAQATLNACVGPHAALARDSAQSALNNALHDVFLKNLAVLSAGARLVAAHDARVLANEDLAAALRAVLGEWQFGVATFIASVGGYGTEGWKVLLEQMGADTDSSALVIAYIDLYGHDPEAMKQFVEHFSAQDILAMVPELAGVVQGGAQSVDGQDLTPAQQEALAFIQQFTDAVGLGVSQLSIQRQRQFADDLMDWPQDGIYPDAFLEQDVIVLLDSSTMPVTVFERVLTIMDRARALDPDAYPPAAADPEALGAPILHSTGLPVGDLADVAFQGLARDPDAALNWFTTDTVHRDPDGVEVTTSSINTDRVERWMQEYNWGYNNSDGITATMAGIGGSPETEALWRLGTNRTAEQDAEWQLLQQFIIDSVTALAANDQFFADTTTQDARDNMADALTYSWDSILAANNTDNLLHTYDYKHPGIPVVESGVVAGADGLIDLLGVVWSGPMENLARYLAIAGYNPGDVIVTGAQQAIYDGLDEAILHALHAAGATGDPALAVRLLDAVAETAGIVDGAVWKMHLAAIEADSRNAAEAAQRLWIFLSIVAGHASDAFRRIPGIPGLIAAAAGDGLALAASLHAAGLAQAEADKLAQELLDGAGSTYGTLSALTQERIDALEDQAAQSLGLTAEEFREALRLGEQTTGEYATAERDKYEAGYNDTPTPGYGVYPFNPTDDGNPGTSDYESLATLRMLSDNYRGT
jgi:hypothetical protein